MEFLWVWWIRYNWSWLGQENGFIDLWRAFQHWNSIVWPLLGLPGESNISCNKHIFLITKDINFRNSSAALLQLEILHTYSLLSTYTWNEPFPNPSIFGLLQHSQTTKNFAVPLQIKQRMPKKSVFIGWNSRGRKT